MQRRAAEESLTDHGKDNSNGRAHVGDAIRHKPGILGFLRQIGFMGATRKFPEARVACGNELSDAHAGYRAVLYIIRDQLHLVPGKLGEGQADHYIFPPVPCPVIDARGDLDDRNSRWQNRQPAMLARTRPRPAGAWGTPGRAVGRCAAV